MPVSNSDNFSINATDCIRMAFQEITVLTEGDYLEQYDFDFAKKKLNMMLKTWQSQQNHLWVKQTATLFLQPGQNTYNLSDSIVDHSTVNTVATTNLSANAAIGATVLTVTSSVGFTAADHIGITMDNGYIHWTTVSNVLGATSIQIALGLTVAATSGNYVFGYTTNLGLPFQVSAAARHNVISGNDIPMNYMAYREYFDQPNKTAQGVPTMWTYDRQLTYFNIPLWPTPVDTTEQVKLIVFRHIQDIDTNSDDFDLPQEWAEAIVANLAVRLAPPYGKAQGENFAELKDQAMRYEALVLSNDNELGSIYIKPSRDGFRRP
jgi:hypothetical protein